jgi:phosphate-selective porin OprO/OprP
MSSAKESAMDKRVVSRLTLVLVATALMLASASAVADPVKLEPTSNDGILVFASKDGMFKWWIDTRVYIDASFYMDDDAEYSMEIDDEDVAVHMGSGVQIRRARMAWKAILWKDWYAEVDVDFAEEATALKDAYVRYDNLFDRQGYVRVGNFRTPFGLEENTSSRYLLFMERSQGTDPFVPGRRIGAEVAYWTDMFRVAGGVFGPDVEDFETNTEDQLADGYEDMNWNFVGRATVAPMMDEHKVLHVGGAYAMMKPTFTDKDDVGTVRFRARNETHISDFKFVSTGKMKDAESYTLFGGELAFVMDRLMLQGEYMGATVKLKCDDAKGTREDSCEPSFSGMYGLASYFLTNDTHPYDQTSGEFTQVKPTGDMGAVELVARYSMLNLTDEDADILGGESTAMTFGLNWYPNANIKVMADYTIVDNDENADGDGDFTIDGEDGIDYGMFQMRFQAAF